MHALHPMHASLSRSTIPSGRFSSARTGQIVTHGAFVHWLQRSTAKCRRTCGKVPISVYFTQVRKLPTGTWFSDLHATVHAWQPMHLRWSMTNPCCMGGARMLRAHAAAAIVQPDAFRRHLPRAVGSKRDRTPGTG